MQLSALPHLCTASGQAAKHLQECKLLGCAGADSCVPGHRRQEAYERELEKLSVRRNPLGMDRHHRFYWYPPNPLHQALCSHCDCPSVCTVRVLVKRTAYLTAAGHSKHIIACLFLLTVTAAAWTHGTRGCAPGAFGGVLTLEVHLTLMCDKG